LLVLVFGVGVAKCLKEATNKKYRPTIAAANFMKYLPFDVLTKHSFSANEERKKCFIIPISHSAGLKDEGEPAMLAGSPCWTREVSVNVCDASRRSMLERLAKPFVGEKRDTDSGQSRNDTSKRLSKVEKNCRCWNCDKNRDEKKNPISRCHFNTPCS
jgi:hypothetical protein